MPPYLIFAGGGALASYGYSSDALPLPTGAVQCTAAQLAQAPLLALVAGVITIIAAPAPPAPTLAQQAAAALATNTAAGIVLTSTGTPALNGTYALDAVSQAQVFQIGLYANQFGAFPSGAGTQAYPDAGAVPHTFGVTAFVAFLKAVAALVSAQNTQAAIMAQGGSPSWPSNLATIA
jgi:hypothetical protein